MFRLGIINKNNSYDEKISYAIFAQFAILTFQYLILYFFNIDETTIGNIIKLVSKFLVAISMAKAFPIVIKRKLKLIVITYCALSSLFMVHYILFPQNRGYILNIVFSFFCICLPCFLYTYSIIDFKDFFNVLEKVSFFILCIGFLIFILVIFKIINIGTYSMSLSYNLLFPCLFYLYKYLDNFKVKYIIMILLSIVPILVLGARGPILCIGCYVIIFLINEICKKNPVKKEFLYFFSIIFILLSLIFFDEILTIINNILNYFGIYSRTISLFLENNLYLSGREIFYNKTFELLQLYPIIGVGIAGDRFHMNGSYVHNLFLELLLNFGIVLGTLIIIMLIVFFIKKIFFIKGQQRKLFNVFFCMGVIPLMISGSYLTSPLFWIYLALCLRTKGID